MKRDGDASQKLKSAIMYPIVIALAAIGVVVLMATYVLPKLTVFFKEFDAKLPLSSRILLGVSDFFKNNWWFTPLVIGLLRRRLPVDEDEPTGQGAQGPAPAQALALAARSCASPRSSGSAGSSGR